MKKDVMIAIKGMLELDGTDSGGDELVTQGVYWHDGKTARLTYLESELTGMEGTRTTFEVDPYRVSLTREGTVNAQMMFELGKKHLFLYDTPYGAFTMGVSTNSIKSKLDDNGGNLEIKCVVSMENSSVSRNTFSINVREITQ
jgi:uncharacterized beta-barrel protein YwiB (DUF1934 family)